MPMVEQPLPNLPPAPPAGRGRWAPAPRPALLAAALALMLAPPAGAQPRHLDQSQFIDGLRREGMSELLLHLLQTEKKGLDPIEAREIEISQYQLQAQNARLPQDQRLAALDRSVSLRRQLIKDHYDQPLRPIWQTDLAEMLLLEYFGIAAPRAAEFYEFGTPTPQQQQAFATVVPEALALTVDAENRIFRLQTELPARPDYEKKYQLTGLSERLLSDYGAGRTPFFLAQAAYFTALLPDDHAYYQALGRHPVIPAAIQKTKPAEERARLLLLAADKLGPFVSPRQSNEVLRFTALCLQGRIELARGSQSAAQDLLLKVLAARRGDGNEVLARLALAASYQRQNRSAEFQDVVERLSGSALVREDLSYLLLTVDLVHRSLMQKARAIADPAKRAEAVAAAYEPYDAFLNDRRLDPARRQALRAVIFQRWDRAVDPAQSLDELPPLVVVGMAEVASGEGQGLMQEAAKAPPAGRPALQRQARSRLQRALDLCHHLLGRKNLTPSQRAQTLLNLGLATFYTAPDQPAVIYQATDFWVQLGQEHPDQPLAETAITEALRQRRRLFDLQAPDALAKYRQAVEVLFSKFPTSAAADNEYAFYAYTVLEPAGQWEQALALYDKVPPGHLTWFDAQRQALACLGRLHEQAQDSPKKGELAEKIRERAVTLRQEAEQALKTSAEGPQAASCRAAAGYARMALVDVAVARRDFAAAEKLLRDFQQESAADPDLVRQAQQRQILLLVAQNQLDAAAKLAGQMMDRFPDAAAPLIDETLTGLDQQLDALKRVLATETGETGRRRLEEQIARLSNAAATFASLLNDWAAKRRLPDAQMLPIKIIFAKSLRASGQADKALQILEPLVKDPALAKEGELIHQLAETHYALGAPEHLDAAYRNYLRLIQGIAAADGRYPPRWWNAWMRCLQVRDQLKKDPQQILAFIQQLRLKDPNLGGEPYRSEFQRLEVKYRLAAPARP